MEGGLRLTRRVLWLLLPPMLFTVAGSLALMLTPIRPPGASGYELDPMRWVPIGVTLVGLVWLLVAGLVLLWREQGGWQKRGERA